VLTFRSIVAIHGLDGHREKSWTAENDVLWLRDLLAGDSPQARILTYGYDANTRGHAQLTHLSLYDHAQNFISKLALFRRNTPVSCRFIVPLDFFRLLRIARA
jgi:hypothetical protein